MNKLDKFSPDFKKRAVEAAMNSGKPLKQVAKDMGCSLASIHIWKRKFKKGEEFKHIAATKVKNTPSIQSLQKDNSQLRIEIEVLRGMIKLLMDKI